MLRNSSVSAAPETAPLSFNRLFHQIISIGHHSFKTKFYSILIQIFGRYRFFENETISIEHCPSCNTDIHRIHVMKSKYLDPVKLLNPFKWIEFFIVAPLEMLSFSFCRLPKIAIEKLMKLMEPPKTRENEQKGKKHLLFYVRDIFAFLSLLVCYILILGSFIIDLGINLITGTIRRCCFLAPARYIVRPAIETAKKYPTSFANIVIITAIATLSFTILIVTGSLPATVIVSQFLTFTLATKLTMISVGAIFLGSILTKGVNTAYELVDGLSRRKRNYLFNTIMMDKEPTLDTLNQDYQNNTPLIIIHNVSNCFIYGLSPKGEKKLERIENEALCHSLCIHFIVANSKGNDNLIKTLCSKHLCQTVLSQEEKNKIREISLNKNIYKNILSLRIHFQKRTGSTAEITRNLQNVDLDNTDLMSIDQSNPYHRASLWAGIESLTHPGPTVIPTSSSPRLHTI